MTRLKYNGDPKNDCWDIGSFTITKEMMFPNKSSLEWVASNLDILSEEKFNNIVVPDFSYTIAENILSLKMDYISGKYIHTIHHYNVIYDELVERDSEYSMAEYKPQNFIVKDDRVYLIDLDQWVPIRVDQRKKIWEDTYKIFAPIIRSYKGKHQMKVDLSCHDLEYLKLKKLFECVFNGVVTRSESPYFARINDLEFSNLKDTSNYLADLYRTIKKNLDINPIDYGKPHPIDKLSKDILGSRIF